MTIYKNFLDPTLSPLRGGYCKFCVLFRPKSSRIQSGVLVTAPMCKYNKATGRCGYLSVHENTDYHKDAVLQSLKLCISRNGPYIGGHLAFYFKSNFKQVYNVL